VPDVGIWREDQELTPELLKTQLAIKQEALLELFAERDWDFAMVVFKCLDVLSHRAYDGRVPGTVAAWCVELDRALGELVDAVGEGTNVIVLSDHGFHAYPFEFFPYSWLLEEGYATARASASASPVGGPLATARAAEHAQRVSALDLSRTRVLAGAAEGNFGGLRLNLRGREGEGAVDPAEADALLDELEERLRALELPGSDEPLVVEVWRARELYPGPFAAGLLPDLLFETHADVAVRPVPHATWFEKLQGTFPDHAREGIWVAAGPSIAPRAERGSAEIADLAPTALHLLGLPIYAEMQGRVLTEQLAAPREPRAISGEEHAAGRAGAFASEEGAASAEVLERLRMLGYADAVEDSARGGAPEDR
jgi:predicted AlkP superfamily phosphohydrolase/phosphomutase